MKKFVFTAGWRRVTVYADSLGAARSKARNTLDKRCEKEGREPPVAWPLRRVKTTEEPIKEAMQKAGLAAKPAQDVNDFFAGHGVKGARIGSKRLVVQNPNLAAPYGKKGKK